MGNFFIKIGKGLLYLLVLPIFIVLIAVVAVIGLVGFFFLFLKQLFLFFTGRSLYEDLPEDIKAKAIIEGQNGNPYAQNTQMQQPQYQQNQFQQTQVPYQQPQLQQNPTVVNLNISPDTLLGNSSTPFIVQPEPTREPEILPEPEPEAVLPDPAPEVNEIPVEEVSQAQQPQQQEKKINSIYHSGEPVFMHIKDDDDLL